MDAIEDNYPYNIHIWCFPPVCWSNNVTPLQTALQTMSASLFLLHTDVAAALGLLCKLDDQPVYWLGSPDSQVLDHWLGHHASLEPVFWDIIHWNGEGLCLLDMDSAESLISSKDASWVNNLSSHPYCHRMAWIGTIETLSVIPVLQQSGIPRYLNTCDVLAPIWLDDWLQRIDLSTNSDAATLLAQSNAVQTWTIDGSAALDKTVHEVMEQCQQWHTHAASELRTCLLEALTNALYHAPITRLGALKYEKHQRLEGLPPEDWVTVAIHLWQGWVVVTITDHWGRLTPATLLKGLYHQTTDEGLLNEDGRGMLLMHLLPQGWANFCAPNHQLTTVFIHPTQMHPSPEANPARSFWFVEGV